MERRLVAVMFTDMVGYTALVESDEPSARAKRDLYMGSVERHHEAHGGTVVQRLGDGSMGMFPSALAAAEAAAEIQRELGAAGVRVRIGVHVGDVIVETERLTGSAVNVASRIESFAVPGSVLLSDAAFDQVRNQPGLDVAPLGTFRFKNVSRPFELYALRGDGLVVPERAELEGKGERIVAIRGGLPEPAAPLLGRDREVAALIDLMREHRVVSIVGPGGVGKTRLALETGRRLTAEFAEGVLFTSFTDVADASAFLPTLAAALDVKEAEGRTALNGIVGLVEDRRVLLVLDNLEQIVDAAADVAALVERCAGLRILVTTRMPLRIGAEQTFLLEPLPLDAALALLVERARTTLGSFAETPENEETLRAICARLDGLPLALELAAARLRLLDPRSLLERLDRALDVLASGRRDSHARQQTLRATIDWSHSLLDAAEQASFRRLAAFSGGCTLGDAELVTSATLDQLESLVEKALAQVGVNGRLTMLQTILDYARERLEESGEADTAAGAHARRYAAVANEIGLAVEGTGQLAAVERAIAEEANLLAALDWLLTRAQAGDGNAASVGMGMCGDLWMYWHIRGKNLTARDYAAAFLEADRDGTATSERAGALLTAGLASWIAGDFERSDAEWTDAYEVAEAARSERHAALAAMCRALALMSLDPRQGLTWAREANERGRRSGLPWVEGFAFTFEGLLHAIEGNAAAAEQSLERALAIQERLGDHEGAGLSLGGLGQLAASRGEEQRAVELYQRSLHAFETLGDRAEEARILSETGWVHLQRGDAESARRDFLDAAGRYLDVASVRGVGLALVGVAATAARNGRPAIAATLAAAAEVYAAQDGIVNVYGDDGAGRDVVEAARAALGEAELHAANDAGRGLTIAGALDLARIAVP